MAHHIAFTPKMLQNKYLQNHRRFGGLAFVKSAFFRIGGKHFLIETEAKADGGKGESNAHTTPLLPPGFKLFATLDRSQSQVLPGSRKRSSQKSKLFVHLLVCQFQKV